MANEVIQVGSRIEIRQVVKQNEAEPAEYYVSQFFKWADNNVATIAVPIYKGHLVPLRLNAEYELEFITKNGLYRCRGKIIKRSKTSNNIDVADVKFVSALEKFQRRQYYRLNCIMPISYAILSEEQLELYKEKKKCLSSEQKLAIEKKLEKQSIVFEKATVLDLSGGGLRFNSPVQLEIGTVLLLQFPFPEAVRKKIPFLLGKIISSRNIPTKEQVIFDNRVEFIEITSTEQEQIITYIFKEERNKRRKENEKMV